MGRLSGPRVFLSGLIAGIVIGSIQYLFDSFLFSERWTAVAGALSTLNGKVVIGPAAVVALLQLAALAAGQLAARFYAAGAGRESPSVFQPAVAAWALSYGVLAGGLFLLSRSTPEGTAPPLETMHLVTFALCGLLACVAGTSLGGWIFRQSEYAAAEV